MLEQHLINDWLDTRTIAPKLMEIYDTIPAENLEAAQYIIGLNTLFESLIATGHYKAPTLH